MHLSTNIAKEIGRALRGARRVREMTLRDVGTASAGRFKPTAVAGYERAERSITLERFCELAQVYGMGPDRLVSQIMWRVSEGPEPILDLTKVATLPDAERETVIGYIGQVRRLRDGGDDGTITLRIRDLEVLATASGSHLGEFLTTLAPALVVEESSS